MAKAFLQQRKGRSSFYVCWRQDGRKVQRPVGSDDEDYAEKVREQVQKVLDGRSRTEELQRILVDAGVPELPDPRIRLEQVRDFYEQRRKSRRVKERTMKDKLGKLDAFVTWVQERHPEIVYVHELTEQIAGEYMEHLRDTNHTGQTQNNHLSALRSIWSEIKIPAYLPLNPWSSVQRVEAIHESKKAFTLRQVQKLYRETQKFESRWPGFWPAAVALGFHTGLRLSDVIELEADEYQRESGVLHLVPNKTWKHGQPLVLPLHADFDRWIPRVKEGYFWPDLAENYQEGKTWTAKTVFQEWRTLVQRALEIDGIQKQEATTQRIRPVVQYGFHSLRHTYVSIAREKGAPIDDIKHAVGHGSPAMTEHYDQSLDAAKRTGELMPELGSN